MIIMGLPEWRGEERLKRTHAGVDALMGLFSENPSRKYEDDDDAPVLRVRGIVFVWYTLQHHQSFCLLAGGFLSAEIPCRGIVCIYDGVGARGLLDILPQAGAQHLFARETRMRAAHYFELNEDHSLVSARVCGCTIWSGSRRCERSEQRVFASKV